MEDFFCRTTELFLLDFNQVRKITMDDAGIAIALEAFHINDPYYPRPLRTSKEEQMVWRAFMDSYLNASDSILQEKEKVTIDILLLPRKFIQGRYQGREGEDGKRLRGIRCKVCYAHAPELGPQTLFG
jgi:hypothetical protein